MPEIIYLDNHSTTPCDPRVVAAMLPYFTESCGNASSGIHQAGREANEAVTRARRQIASLIGAAPHEVVFTSGATESNNLAVRGVALASRNGRRRIVTTAIEHKAVLSVCRDLGTHGYDLVVLPVDREGRISIESVESAVNEHTLLISVQAANNEIGTIQAIAEIAALAHERGALVHCDAAQAVGKIPVDVQDWEIDLLSISAHKLYGPKGVGALYIRGGVYGIPISPLQIGGGQEWGLRPGTMNVPGIVGFGEACAICECEMDEEAQRTALLRDHMEFELLGAIPGLVRNGAISQRLPNNSNLTIPGVEAEALVANLRGIAISTGAACASGAPEPSHVLLALGLSRADAYSTIRIGLGRFNNRSDVTGCTTALKQTVERLSMSLP